MLLNARALNGPATGEGRASEKRGFFYRIYFTLLALLLPFAVALAFDEFAEFPLEFALLFVNGGLSIYGQLKAVEIQSPIHFISFLFCYLFMSLMPILQIGYKTDPVFAMENIVLLSSLAALIFTICGMVSVRGTARKIRATPPSPEHRQRQNHLFFLALLVFGACVVSLALFGKGLFTSREGFGFALGDVFTDRAIAGIVINFLMQGPVFGAAMGLRAAMEKRSKPWIITYCFLLLLSFVINNPLITPRFRLAGLVFFFIDYFFKGKNLKLIVILMLAGISLAPLFQVFRHDNDMATASAHINYGEKFISTDYDAFQIMCYTFVTVDKHGFTWGSNLLGATLFFVPRALWPEKPEPSSFAIYDTAMGYEYLGTNNLSVPLMIEGYYAFSWVGLLLISVLYWFCLGRLHLRSLKDNDSLSFVLRCVYVGLVLIFLRGPLVTSVSNVVGNFLAALLAWWVLHGSFGAGRDRSAAASGREAGVGLAQR